MTGTHESFSVEIDDAELRRTLHELMEAVQVPAIALREIGEVLLQGTKNRFSTETGPDGQRWPENSDVTLMNYLRRKRGISKRRTKGGGHRLTKRGHALLSGKKILTQRGYLADTLRYQLTEGGQAVLVGSNRAYAAMQQFGGTRARWPHLWGDIPPRPFLGISSADRAATRRIMLDYLRRAAA